MTHQSHPTSSQQASDESAAAFFEHLKHSMDDEEAYEEFLKILEMFSMDILDADSLLERLYFLSPDEMDHLLELLGWDDDKANDESGVENDSFERRRALSAWKQASNVELVSRVGPSYRSCPVVVSLRNALALLDSSFVNRRLDLRAQAETSYITVS